MQYNQIEVSEDKEKCGQVTHNTSVDELTEQVII